MNKELITHKRERNEEGNNVKQKQKENDKDEKKKKIEKNNNQKKDKQAKKKNENSDDEENDENNEESDGEESFEYDFSSYLKQYPNHKIVNMPRKSKFRMRAHCNPLADVTIAQ
jgi:hypothetical protein